MGHNELNLYEKARISGRKIFAVAPMIDWTDRHCRYLHRQISRHALLYTEMVVADAIIHGPRDRLLGHDVSEHPVALQLGGSDPAKLSNALQIAEAYNYDEINLNVGCPSDRVQSGTFGACLMLTPETVAECIAAMKAVSKAPVTVKCRIGVDEQEPEQALPELIARVLDAGADAIWVHARKAWLKGLSPKENREIPPLDYDIVYRMKQRWPDVFIGINGGIQTLDQAEAHLAHVDGVMLGRAAYQNAAILADVDHRFFGEAAVEPDWNDLRDRMMAYTERHIASGGRVHHVARHMVGLFTGLPGSRRYRQILSTDANKPGAEPEVIAAAFAAVDFGGDAERVSA
ncbi:tRNA dihydrouridine(20/20a) synthase DusA [Rhizobium rhizogenes]|nr:tRNA dihydrouridine(20/20a) synthase DusA [Rhizobium rhizogenes]TRB14798.1 tRNA dihydrouridine(20/20a) synthase DusA [Rhizobium rhizogenes]TRB47590.1 tRNA dihydrouridine(20/20a) synthase DusA [Rhizobium rhizogenes]TRB65358.1 tRNA dihydrouridine(20/20a) synthase DusA [Rhizobium rhizogenes]